MIYLKNRKITSFLLASCLACSFAHGAIYTVSSASSFNSLVGTLSAGDTVIWEDGTYSNQNIVFVGASGTASNPITLIAETPGGVKFTGSSELNIAGDYLIVDGFFWDGGTGTTNHVEFRQASSGSNFGNNCILRNCAFDDLATTGDTKSRWVVVYGQDNIIEYCTFLNKNSTGACILVELAYQGGTTAGHTIQNNYFYNFPAKDGRSNSGDCEAIRIGVSLYQNVDAAVLVQNNYFKETDGENEIITNKSRNNIYLDNTFRKCRGSLVMRHGAGAWVEGNYFLGEFKANSGGIRITDSDHIILNNYMQELDNSSSYNNGITLMGGNTPSGGTTGGYQNVDDILIAFNTIYASEDPIYYNSSQGSYVPTGTIANNLIYSTYGTIVSGDLSLETGTTWAGNVFGGSTIGLTDAGITVANANFAASGEISKPSSSGAAANTAAGSYSSITSDIEGRTRPSSNKDVGAHEVSGGSGSSLNPPITDAEVGDAVGCCYLDDAGSAIGCGGSGSATLNPIADAFVSEGASGTNYGSSDKYELKNSSGYTKQAYLKYALSGVSGTVTSAVLRIKVRSSPTGNHTVSSVSDDSWTEGGITWSNKPSVGTGLDTDTVPTAGSYIEFDVTSYVNTEASGDGVVSFVISSDNASTVSYHSKEAGSPDMPELVISWTAVTEETLNPTEDAFVSEGTSGTNYGSSDKYEVKESSGYAKRAFLKYSLSSITGTVTSALLRVKVRSTPSGNHSVRSASTDSWAEGTITWSNRPSVGSIIDTEAVPTAGDYIEFDVTTYVASEAAGDGVVSFAITSDNASTVSYHSKEAGGSDMPELVVTY